MVSFFEVATSLDDLGLIWAPEIGDEVSPREQPGAISVLVDPQGMTPNELRSVYLWLPTFEQMVFQLEARQAILFHVGLELSAARLGYKTVIQTRAGTIEATADTPRSALGLSLADLLAVQKGALH